MNIFITGGTGFVGRRLCDSFLAEGHRVTAVGRSRNPNLVDHVGFHYISADTTQTGDWQAALTDQDVIVNLAGKSIFTLWTEQSKKEIHDSRVLTTRNLVDALPADNHTVLCSTSAVGYYGDRGEDKLTETEPRGDDFLATVAADWEAEALGAQEKGARVILMRFGIVLGSGGGIMEKMIPAFNMYLGGPLGDGRQWFPWIHMADLVRACRFTIDTPDMSGPVNFCAPRPVRNEDMVKVLAEKLNRPAVMKLPAFMVKTLGGEFGETMLSSQRGEPAKLIERGFEFRYPDMKAALADIVGSN